MGNKSKNKKLNSGFSLLELIAGGVIAGIVLSATLRFYSGFQRGQARNRLKTQASSEIQSFFNNRKKSFAKFDPSNPGSLNFTPLLLTFPKTLVNLSSLARTIINESIEVVCGVPIVALSSLPANYNCNPAVCSAPQVPISVRVRTQGNIGEVYPSPNSGVPMMASLCMTNDYALNGTITMRLTYVMGSGATQNFETVSRTEIISVPKTAPGGQLKPEILGTVNSN